MEIIEHKKENGKDERVLIIYELAVTEELSGIRSQEEYKKYLTDKLRIESANIFEMIEYFGDVLMCKDIRADMVGVWINLLGSIGQSINDASETVEIYFRRKAEEQNENVLDLSAHPAECQSLNKLAAQISEVMKNPLLPKDIYNVLADELNEVPNQADSPEWILANLKKQRREFNDKD